MSFKYELEITPHKDGEHCGMCEWIDDVWCSMFGGNIEEGGVRCWDCLDAEEKWKEKQGKEQPPLHHDLESSFTHERSEPDGEPPTSRPSMQYADKAEVCKARTAIDNVYRCYRAYKEQK